MGMESFFYHILTQLYILTQLQARMEDHSHHRHLTYQLSCRMMANTGIPKCMMTGVSTPSILDLSYDRFTYLQCVNIATQHQHHVRLDLC
jgi:hypothetical protein